MLQQKWVKIAPHLVDTVLLLTGIWMALQLKQLNGNLAWLWPKMIALLLYIVSGMIAFRFAKKQTTRILFWLLALASAAYILVTAYTKNPLWVLQMAL